MTYQTRKSWKEAKGPTCQLGTWLPWSRFPIMPGRLALGPLLPRVGRIALFQQWWEWTFWSWLILEVLIYFIMGVAEFRLERASGKEYSKRFHTQDINHVISRVMQKTKGKLKCSIYCLFSSIGLFFFAIFGFSIQFWLILSQTWMIQTRNPI